MASSSTPPPTVASSAGRTPGQSRIITLQLSKDLLKRFPSEPSEEVSSPSNSAVDNGLSASAVDSNPSTAVGTPSASLLAPPLKRKGIPGPKPGMKRNQSQMTIDGVPKPRGKPGPKKKMRVDGVNGVQVPVSAPKINPKANQGAINANLRALDRTGKPCRKWDKKTFQVKSFTGILWSSPTWSAPNKATTDFPGDVKSDSSGSSDVAKPTQDSSVVPSEKSNSGGDGDTPMPTIIETASSPPAAPVAVA